MDRKQLQNLRRKIKRRRGTYLLRLPGQGMKLVSFVLLLAGWALVLSAIVLLGSEVPRNAFVLAGCGVEILGLVLAFRSHLMVKGERG